ncbi:MAG: response regulator transcription factor [Candidatus Dormibacteraceae bacterium]
MAAAQAQRGRKKVLLVEDDPGIRAVVREICRHQGYDMAEAPTGGEGMHAIATKQPDLVVLDWVLPDISGLDVCREIRRQGVSCPVIMLTARASKVDVVVGLEVGADDYVTKPFDSRELAARLGAHLRRSSQSASEHPGEGLLKVGGVEIDTEGRRVRIDGNEVGLTMTEFNLLALLAANPGRVLTRGQLLEKVWGYLADVDYHSVDPHIQRLRRKLGSTASSRVQVDAVPGLGYRLSIRD